MSRPIRFIAAIVFAAAMLLPATALAAPLAWEKIDVTIHTEQTDTTMLISGTLPADAKLPAQVEIAAPAGASVMWAGEILGGPVEQDPTVQYTKVTKGETDVYSFTLSKARTGQIELSTPGIVSQQGADYGVALKYTPSQDVKTVNLAVRMPSTAQIRDEVAGATRQPGGQANFAYYTKSFPNVKAASPVDLSFVYSAAAPAATPAASTGSNNVLVTLIVLLAAAGLGALLMSVARKMKTQQTPAAAPARKRPAAATIVERDDEEDQDGLFADADDEDDESVAYAEDDEDDEDTAEVRRGLSGPQKVGLAGLLAAIVMVVALMGQQNSSQWVAGKLSKQYGGTDACTMSRLPVTPPQGKTLEDVGPAMLKALAPVTGIKSATIDKATQQIEIQYCDSQTNEPTLRQALAGTGVQLGEAVTGAAPGAEVETTTPTAQ